MANGQGSAARWLGDVAALTLCYFIAGYIGLQIAVPPGYATIIWPASGVALAALLLRDRSIWPGIWLGSFSINVYNSLQGLPDLDGAPKVCAIAAGIACGAVAQALVGHYFARRFAGGVTLSTAKQAFKLFRNVVVLPCLVAPIVGVGTLFLAGVVTADRLVENFLTWAGGDILGVLFVLPILLLSRHSPIPLRWKGRAIQGTSSVIAMFLMATLLLTFYAWRYEEEKEYDTSVAAFSALATDTEQALKYRLATYERALDVGSAFAANSTEITPGEWHDYVERLDLGRAYPGMRGLGFFEAVPENEMPRYRQAFNADYGNRFAIHPQVDREEHFVINRIEPLSDNMAALGLDLAFEEGRRNAIARSLEEGRTTMTRPIVLVQDAKQGVGFLILKPIKEDSAGSRPRWSYAPLVAGEFLANLTPREGRDFSLEVYFGTEPSPDTLMFATSTIPEHPRFEQVRHIEMANQPVTLRWRSLTPFEDRVSSQQPLLVLLSGIIITILLGVLLIAFTRREATVLRKVEEATAELEERNRMLELAEATAHVGHWHLDPKNERIQWSDEVFRLHGRDIGTPPPLEDALDYYHPDDRDLVVESVDRATATGEAYRFVARLIRDDGEIRHVEVIGQVETGPGGQVVSIFGVIIDRTDEIAMRQNLTRARDEAEAADKAKTSFLANMSHEIRTPMNGVIGFTELALSEEKSPVQRRRLQMIADSSNAMLRLLNDLLDFAKIEANQMTVSDEPTDLRHSLRGVMRLMEPVALGKGLSLSLEIDRTLPTHVMIDKMRLRQVVLNLLGNALKFTETGKVKLDLQVTPADDGAQNRMTITVSDTGIGIPADRLSSVFEKFTQADNTTARRYGGTGLGLPISAQLVELMGGSIRVESEVGEGSRFIVDLPLRETEQIDHRLKAGEQSEDCGHPVALRILVAEDNPVNQELTLAMVDKAGHFCDLARNGREAVDMAIRARRNGNPYDLVLMDMQMPILDGISATTAIREAGFRPDTLPIVAVTANAYSDDIRRCHEAGMQGHIAKPLRMGELCNVLATCSPKIATPMDCPAPVLEKETDPRLNQMFQDRVATAIEKIDAALADGEPMPEARTEIASLLHQIAGVAGYFGRAALGECCRDLEHQLLSPADDQSARRVLSDARDALDGAGTEVDTAGPA